MQEPDELPSLDKLGGEILRLQEKKTSRSQPEPSGASQAVQAGFEMVAGVAVGGGLGWLLDSWFGTSPFMMIVCFFFGAAGGGLTLYRRTMRAPEANDDTRAG